MKDKLQLLVFSLDDRSYAVQLHQVVRVIRAVDATPLPDAPAIVTGIIDLQGEIVPLLNIRRRFGLADREIAPRNQFIIARTSKRTVLLAVDCVTDVIERPAEEMIATKHLEQIEGVIQLEDGLTLIHNLERFLSLDEERVLETALAGELADAR